MRDFTLRGVLLDPTPEGDDGGTGAPSPQGGTGDGKPTGQEPAPDGQEPEGDDPDGGSSDDLDPEALAAANAQLRQENAKRRKNERDLEGRLQEIENQGLSEQQRLEKERDDAVRELDDLRKEVKQMRVEGIVKDKARDLGLVDPPLVTMLAMSRIEFDDDGQPQDVEAVVRAIIKEKPHLAGKDFDNGDGQGGQPPRGRRPDADVAPGTARMAAAYSESQGKRR